MLKFSLSVALFIAAAPAFGQEAPAAPPAATPSGPQAAIQTAATAFGQCVSAGVQGITPDVAPEAGAVSVLSGCTPQRDQLVQAAEAMIATLPADQQAAAREQLRTQLGEVETHVAAAIRRHRAAPAPAAAE